MSSVGLIPYGPCCLTRVMAIDILLFKGSESGIYLNLLNCFDYFLSMMGRVKMTLIGRLLLSGLVRIYQSSLEIGQPKY